MGSNMQKKIYIHQFIKNYYLPGNSRQDSNYANNKL
jgi:hypothetical protein